MKVDVFDFELGGEFIAHRPARPRDTARLLGVGASLNDHSMGELPELLRRGDLLVFNNTRVIPARLVGRRRTAKIEVTLHKRLDDGTWRAFARPAKKLRVGDRVEFADDFSCTVNEKGEGGEVTLGFDKCGDELTLSLNKYGTMPIPPYIKRDVSADDMDGCDYQTMFAEKDGAVAAPTAALHFTPRLMEALERRGIGRAFVTLHVGAGTFLPVRVDDTSDHKMHSEWGDVSAAAAKKINEARDCGGRLVAVGTTSLRLLETAADEAGRIQPFSGETDIFITPGYKFSTADMLLTNFHLPRPTLFMLVSAFAGLKTMRDAYEHAKNNGYRFYSYGDGCLLQRLGQNIGNEPI